MTSRNEKKNLIHIKSRDPDHTDPSSLVNCASACDGSQLTTILSRKQGCLLYPLPELGLSLLPSPRTRTVSFTLLGDQTMLAHSQQGMK